MPGNHGGQKAALDPQTGVTGHCELSSGRWESDPGPLEEQSVLLTAEPSLHPRNCLLKPVFPSYLKKNLEQISPKNGWGDLQREHKSEPQLVK